jgi:putative oxidoreductase
MTCKTSHRADLALLMIRIGTGTVFIGHALMHLQVGVGSLATLLGADLGFPLPNLFAWLTVLIELFGGIALVIGVAGPIAAGLLSLISIITILTLKAKLGLIAKVGVGAELDIALLVGSLAVALQGAGWYSLDRKLGWFGAGGECCVPDEEKAA